MHALVIGNEGKPLTTVICVPRPISIVGIVVARVVVASIATVALITVSTIVIPIALIIVVIKSLVPVLPLT